MSTWILNVQNLPLALATATTLGYWIAASDHTNRTCYPLPTARTLGFGRIRTGSFGKRNIQFFLPPYTFAYSSV